MTVGDFWEAVYKLCHKHGGSVTSGPRSVARNKKVGGAPNSAHMEGLGADVVYDEGQTADRLATATELGLRVIVEGDHDHLQPFDWHPKPTEVA